MEIIEAAEEAGLYIQGHAPNVSGRNLSAYLCGGPNTCHETTGSAEALEKLRMGMYVDASESSIIKNVEAVWNGVKDCKFYETLTLCTDDRESDDLLHEGHMNAAVRKAVSSGMDPVAAIKSATINTAREIGVAHLGAIAPGYVADMVLTKDITTLWADAVFYEGRLVAKDGKLVEPIADMDFEIETRNSMNLAPVTLDDVTIKSPVEDGPIGVNIMEYLTKDSGLTIKSAADFDAKNGQIPLGEDMAYVAVLNRYGKGTKGLGIVKNFGLKEGAIASTVSHDSHNLTIVYLDPNDAVVAANELIACGGGMTAVKDGKVLNTLRLEVGGLMTKLDAEELTVEAAKMKEIERGMGLTVPVNPLLRIVTLALPVVPYVKITDLGMVNTEDQTMIPLFEQII